MEVVVGFFLSVVRVSTPLLLGSMGGLMSERSGVVNIALEGLMLIGAFAAAVATTWTQSPTIGLCASMATGAALAWIYAVFVIRWKADQIVAGTAINLMAAGIPPFLSNIWFDSTTSTPILPIESRFSHAPIWIALLAVAVIAFWLRRSRGGLWLQFAGEKPEALDAAGVSVLRTRYFAVVMSGVLAGMGGASLSIFLSSSFSRNMTAGRGFMALAALILGKWKPIPAAAACLLFGVADVLQIRLQGVTLWGSEPVPVQFIQILPYVLTVLVLAGFVGESRPPKALGLAFEK